MKKNTKNLLIGALVLLFVSVGLYYSDVYRQQTLQPAQQQGDQKQAVSILSLEKKNVSFKHTLPGRVSPFKQSQVRPQVDGIITERLFEEGAYVEKGQQLYQIDDVRYKAALNRAMADLESAKASVKTVEARVDRYKGLVGIDAVSAQEYDDVKADYDQAKASVLVAQAAVDLAKVNLDYTKVYAPISGRIGKSFFTEGALVTANQSQNLAVITQLDPIYIDMQQSGAEILKLRSRMLEAKEVPVLVHLGDETDRTYEHKGVLKFSEVTVDESTGAVALRAVFPNPDNILLPGLFVRTMLDLGEDEALLVPQRATSRKPDGSLNLWVVDESNKAQPKQITVLQAYGDQWIIERGLKEGERVIIEGYQKVGPAMEVRTMTWSHSPEN